MDAQNGRILTREEVAAHPEFLAYVERDAASAGVRPEDFRLHLVRTLDLMFSYPHIRPVQTTEGLRWCRVDMAKGTAHD